MDRLARLVARLLNADVSLVTLVDEHAELLPGQSGLPRPWVRRRRIELEHSHSRDVVERGGIVQLDDASGHRPLTDAGASLAMGSFLGVPLSDEHGTVLGSLCVMATGPRRWTKDDRELLDGLALAVSSELRARIATADAERATAESANATARLRVMADASSVLMATLDPEVALDRILDTIVPRLATWTLVVLAPDEDEGPRVLTRHVDPARAVELDQLAKAHANTLIRVPVIDAVMNGRGARLLTEFGSETVVADLGGSATLAATVERMGLGSVIVVPLTTRSGILGALTFVTSAERSVYDDVDLMIAVDLGRRCALALDNARRFERERVVALELQRSLLPELAEIDGIDACAAYEPASSHAEIGGDWYDLVRAPDGALVAMIGDVTGHNVRAAAAMGRVRGALRSYALEGHGPAAVLEHVERIAEHLLDELLVTCVIVRLELVEGTWQATCANAGHLPPLILDPDGRARFVDVPNDPLIGIARTPVPRRTVSMTMAAHSTLVMYTDGIVERRRERLDEGLDRLRHAVEVHGSRDPIDLICKRLITEIDPDGNDDIAILAIRPTTPR